MPPRGDAVSTAESVTARERLANATVIPDSG